MPTTTARPMRTATAIRNLFFACWSITVAPNRSEGFQVLEQGPFLLGRELGTVSRARVAAVAITALGGVVGKELAPLLLGDVGDEADVLGIVNIIAAVEVFGARVRRFQ